jgi:UDP-N-acetylglucosamine diphosphorylase / glucose-1-phosphate thymidylyltransferase / UDP-N-acetylgalactosamine diphosphorylase / glucosamine-1-phosphate N-acetyltransferase / galactosamine-1-phosphate N-acetyltransferase
MESDILPRFISNIYLRLPVLDEGERLWEIINKIEEHVRTVLSLHSADSDFEQVGPDVIVHSSAEVPDSVAFDGPVVVSAGCRIGHCAVLRGGVWLDSDVTVGPSAEIKGSLIFRGSSVAHLNYVGNSIVGENVNIEAGAVVANHFNERSDKRISVVIDGTVISTELTKFGALVGDRSRIGANAVTSPGTLLSPGSVVPRLGLIDQVSGFGP